MCQRYSARGLGGQDWGQGEGNRWENLFVFKTCIKKGSCAMSALQFFPSRICFVKAPLNLPLSIYSNIRPKYLVNLREISPTTSFA